MGVNSVMIMERLFRQIDQQGEVTNIFHTNIFSDTGLDQKSVV